MGFGRFDGGQVELIVSVRYDASHSVLSEWRACFEGASKILHAMTQGKVRFAKVTLHNNDAWHPAWDADVWLLDEGETSYFYTPHPSIGGAESFGASDVHMALAKTAIKSPFTILHEFGHYAFGLGDEYIGSSGATQCEADQTQKEGRACIMGAKPMWVSQQANVPTITSSGLEWGWIFEFCGDENHEATADSNHNSMHPDPGKPGEGKSCAAVISETRQVPLLSGFAPKELAGYTNVQWGSSAQLFSYVALVETAIVPDEPATIAAEPESFWHYPTALPAPHDQIHLRSFGDGPNLIGIDNSPTIAEGIQAARDAIVNSGPATVQTLVVASTGRQQVNDAGDFGREMASRGTRVFTVGSGKDREALRQLAEAGNGTYYEVRPTNVIQDAERIRSQIMGIYDELRFGPPAVRASLADLAPGQRQEVVVGEGAEFLKLVFSHTPNFDFQVALQHPHGDDFDLHQPGVMHGAPQHGYRVLTIANPDSGRWKVGMTPAADAGGVALTLNGYSFNPKVHVGIVGAHRSYEVGDDVRLQMIVRSPVPVLGLDEASISVTPPPESLRPVSTESFEPRRDGVFDVSFRVSEQGAYDVEIVIENEGSAKPLELLEEPPEGLEGLRIPSFRRVRRFQIHVR